MRGSGKLNAGSRKGQEKVKKRSRQGQEARTRQDQCKFKAPWRIGTLKYLEIKIKEWPAGLSGAKRGQIEPNGAKWGQMGPNGAFLGQKGENKAKWGTYIIM